MGIGAASVCETEVVMDGTVKVSTGEPPVTMDREAPKSLDLTAYRKAATPMTVPIRRVSICSEIILHFTSSSE